MPNCSAIVSPSSSFVGRVEPDLEADRLLADRDHLLIPERP